MAALLMGIAPAVVLGLLTGSALVGVLVALISLGAPTLVAVTPWGTALARQAEQAVDFRNDAQSHVLGAAAANVSRRAGTRLAEVSLNLSYRPGINAGALRGNFVVVRSQALSLPPRQLEALLAHEFGHLRENLHLPRELARRLVLVYPDFARAIWFTAGRAGKQSDRLALRLLACLLWLLAIPISVIEIAIVWIQRGREFEADAFAARLGYRDELIELFTQQLGVPRRREWFGPVPLPHTHPSWEERLAHLEEQPVGMSHQPAPTARR